MINKVMVVSSNSLGELSPGAIQSLPREKFKDMLSKQRQNIYIDEVYEKLKEHQNDFVGFFTGRGHMSALKADDNTEEFQTLLMRRNTNAIYRLPVLHPKTILELFRSYYVDMRQVHSIMKRNSDPSTREDILNKTFRKNPYYVNQKAFQLIGITDENYMTALKRDSSVIRYIPKNRRTPDVLDACITSGKSLAYLSPDERTFDRCMKAVNLAGSALALVPAKIKTQEMCNIAVSKGYSSLGYVPKEMQTGALKMQALIKSNKAKNYIKAEKKG